MKMRKWVGLEWSQVSFQRKGCRMLTIHDLALRFSVCESTIRNWVNRGEFPQPLKIVRTLRWRLADVERWEQLKLTT